MKATIKKWVRGDLERYYISINGEQIGFIQDNGVKTTLSDGLSFEALKELLPTCIRINSTKFIDSVDFYELNRIIKESK